MARSLAQQMDCPVRLTLTVFYSRKEDGDRILEGASDGPCPPATRLIQLAPSLVSDRATRYSFAVKGHCHSHAVFCDADLWYPPRFWNAYLLALASESPGYWSCRVLNLPYAAAEECVEGWMAVPRDRLASLAVGRRHDEQAGRSGHFQCVPRSTLRAALADAYETLSASEFSRRAVSRSCDLRKERRIGAVEAYHMDHPYCPDGTAGVEF